ncbi:hypothetical protein HanRHA438_Chr01g0020431 [Helianthus annuus]|nr:hypothetical protein HanRHA438_Chr01g0020431 [Helianthus annuus]
MKSIFLNKNIMIKSLIHFLFEFLDVIISSVLSLSQKIQVPFYQMYTLLSSIFYDETLPCQF